MAMVKGSRLSQLHHRVQASLVSADHQGSDALAQLHHSRTRRMPTQAAHKLLDQLHHLPTQMRRSRPIFAILIKTWS